MKAKGYSNIIFRVMIFIALAATSGFLAAAPNYNYSILPVPKATAQEFTEACKDNKLQWEDAAAEKENQDLGNYSLSGLVKGWAEYNFDSSERFRNAVMTSCWDGEFVVRQWQRAIGNSEIGKLTSDDLKNFKEKWLPAQKQFIEMAISRCQTDICKQKQQQDFGATPTLVKAADEEKAKANAERAEMILKDRIFGMLLDKPLDLDDCAGPHRTYFPCVVTNKPTGIVPVRFSRDRQPGWVSGDLRVGVQDGVVVSITFTINDNSVAMEALDDKFGTHSTEEFNFHRNASASCFGASCAVTPEDDMKGHRYMWKSKGITATFECMPFCANTITVNSDYWLASEKARKKEKDEMEKAKKNSGQKI